MPKRVLITGITGFTGRHLEIYLLEHGYEVWGLTTRQPESKQHLLVDWNNEASIGAALKTVDPEYVVHLAALSFVGDSRVLGFYEINVIATERFLESIRLQCNSLIKVIVASSANIYGNADAGLITELTPPAPVNHYACSKLSMEYIARNFMSEFNLNIVRPFNYTGVGQAKHFLVPKIVSYFSSKKPVIELGNTNIARDFSSIHYVVEAYRRLLESDCRGLTLNICSGRSIALSEIISTLNEMAGYRIEVNVNPSFVRKNEVVSICGSNSQLHSIVGAIPIAPFEDTLSEMYFA
jgi:GDP-6-deoxy-D-talose 4-dehydrogenase